MRSEHPLRSLAALHENTIWKLSQLERAGRTGGGDEPVVNYKFLASFFLRKLMWADGEVHPSEADVLRQVLGPELGWVEEIMAQEHSAAHIQRDVYFTQTLRAAYGEYLDHIRALYRLELLRAQPVGLSARVREQLDACVPLIVLSTAGKHLIQSDTRIHVAELKLFHEGIWAMCDVFEARGFVLEAPCPTREALLIEALEASMAS